MTNTQNAPQFLNEDAEQILREWQSGWEQKTGKTLYPAQAENILLAVLSYRESLHNARINAAGLQNLVRFADAPVLDYLGEGMDAQRLPAQAASTTLEFYLAAPSSKPVQISAGTLVQSAGLSVTFETLDDAWIAPGALSVTAFAQCVEFGVVGNDYAIGTITELLEARTYAVRNITPTSGGADAERDDDYRARLLLAPAGFSVAGPEDSYKFLAKSVHQSVCDVFVMSPAPCEVNVYVLTDTGLPSANLLAQIDEHLKGTKVRPLSELVNVLAPLQINYQIKARITVYDNVNAEAVLANVHAQLRAMQVGTGTQNGYERKLGVDIIPFQIAAQMDVPGVYSVQLDSPSAQIVPNTAWAHCTNIELSIAGVQHG